MTSVSPHSLRLSAAAFLIAALAALVPASAGAVLPDGRGWEMVSPVEKNGGGIGPAGSVSGGGVLQAAADGNSVTYSSAASFGPGAQSAPAGSQYLSARGGAGWTTENLTVPILSGSFGIDPTGVPYQLFSTDLTRGLLLSGFHCRAQEGTCPVANPPLEGTDAPPGYQNYYLRQDGAGFEPLVGFDDVEGLDVPPAEFDLAFAGAAPDLAHVVLSSCAALTPDATEAPLGGGCDPAKPNLYEWSAASGLSLVNATPGAVLGAQAGAVSADGARVYWSETSTGKLFLGEGATNKQVDAAAGGGGAFQTATPDGGIAFFIKAGHLWRYDAGTGTAVDIAPGGGVTGMLGASASGSRAYYSTAGGIFLWDAGTTVAVSETANASDASNSPPATGTARVSADGGELVFLSHLSLTGYDNEDQKTAVLQPEVFLYSADAGQLRCVSCRPNGLRPIGPSTIPGAVANGKQAGATAAYKPRVLSADGAHVFFDSGDTLAAADTNREPDVYEWEAQGVGGCPKAVGCIALISSGRAAGGAALIDASVSGDDVFFTTDGSLVGSDPGSFDLYDARVGGGFEEALEEIPCFGDACQSLPSEPTDPALSTLVPGPGNPRIIYVKKHRKERKHCKPKAKKCKKGKGGKKGTGGGR